MKKNASYDQPKDFNCFRSSESRQSRLAFGSCHKLSFRCDLRGDKFRLFISKIYLKFSKETRELINIMDSYNGQKKYCKKLRPKILRLLSPNVSFFNPILIYQGSFCSFLKFMGTYRWKNGKMFKPCRVTVKCVVNLFISAINIQI